MVALQSDTISKHAVYYQHERKAIILKLKLWKQM